MNATPRVLVITACAMLAATSVFAEPDLTGTATAMFREMKIDAGTLASVQRETDPTFTAPDGAVFKNLPPRTILKIVLNPAKGSNINVEVWLPDAEKWNGRLLGLGNGGAAGSINPGRLAGQIAGGYAVATTDLGTAPNADSGIGNREVWKDFGFRATHLMTLVAKQAVKTYYGKAPEYSYFYGGSTGGEQALSEAQRYPEDYDGILTWGPAQCRAPLHAYFLWNHQILTRCPFTASQEANVIAAANESMACREIPPIAGKFVSDPRCTSEDIEAVVKLALQKDPTLTDAHAEALRKLFGGPTRAGTGERLFNGIPLGASFEQAHSHLYLFRWVFGPNKNLMDINFGDDIDTYTAALGPYLNAENPDLSAFERRGGKLIVMVGSADACVPYHSTLDYYERVAQHFGGLEKTQAFFRLFIVPGLSHGGGGPGINQGATQLSQILDWREKGVAPDQVPASRVVNGKLELKLPLFPYPAKTGWDAQTASYKPVEGPRGGVERIAERFLPAPGQ